MEGGEGRYLNELTPDEEEEGRLHNETRKRAVR